MELFKLLFKLSSQTEKKFGKLNARFSGLTKKQRWWWWWRLMKINKFYMNQI